MSELRWILLIAGIALIVALYLLGSRNRQRTPVDFERPARVDPPRPASPVETSRLEPRMSLGEADSQLTMDGPDDDLVAEPAAPAPLSARRDPGPGARPQPPMGPEIAIRPEPGLRAEPIVRPSAGARDMGTPRDRAEHRDQAPARAEPRPATVDLFRKVAHMRAGAKARV